MPLYTLKRKCHFDEIFVIVCTRSHQTDNFRWNCWQQNLSKWRFFCFSGSSSTQLSVLTSILTDVCFGFQSLSILFHYLIQPISLAFCGHLGHTELAAVAMALSVSQGTSLWLAHGVEMLSALLFLKGSSSQRTNNVEPSWFICCEHEQAVADNIGRHNAHLRYCILI